MRTIPYRRPGHHQEMAPIIIGRQRHQQPPAHSQPVQPQGLGLCNPGVDHDDIDFTGVIDTAIGLNQGDVGSVGEVGTGTGGKGGVIFNTCDPAARPGNFTQDGSVISRAGTEMSRSMLKS